jgi:hypothetical protein
MRSAFVLSAVLLLAGCSQPPPAPPSEVASAVPTEAAVAETSAPSFINRVWKVAPSSDIPPGALYVFLEEGTLVIASAGNKPSFGSWKFENRALTMVEEGISYPTDILKLTDTEFHLRSHNPGEPVVIRLVRAESSLP